MFELLDCFKKSGFKDDPVLRRDMAAEVFLYLSGQRAGAFVTSPIAAVNINDDEIYQWPDVYHVKTKNGKKATTALFQVPGLIDFVKEYDNWVRQVIPQEMWNEYPWYVGFKNNWGDVSLCLSPLGEKRGNELIKRFKNLANRMKKEYENPHAFRHGHAVYGISHARTPAEYQAVSRNLMHDSIVITDKIYATLEFEDRKKVIEKMHTFAINQPDENLFKILKPMSKEDLVRVIHLAADLMAR
jgi:integrase